MGTKGCELQLTQRPKKGGEKKKETARISSERKIGSTALENTRKKIVRKTQAREGEGARLKKKYGIRGPGGRRKERHQTRDEHQKKGKR